MSTSTGTFCGRIDGEAPAITSNEVMAKAVGYGAMIRVDGSQKSGSGTIVRVSVGMAALLGEELLLTNARAQRDKPGLRPQHLAAIEALTEVCGGSLRGNRVGSTEIGFKPGENIAGGSYEWDIGTAGSTTMLAMTLLPVACFASRPSRFRICGGLFQDFAPSAYHTQHVLLPVLRKMGVEAQLDIVRPGYVPRGGGIVEVRVSPAQGKLKPIRLLAQGNPLRIRGIALSSHLKERGVSDRMAQQCQKVLRTRGLEAMITSLYDDTALQAGAALALYAETSSGCILGADRAGAPRRRSEEIGRYVARSLQEDLDSEATVDRYLADQLIFYAALAEGLTEYRIPGMTEHVDTNLWLVSTVLGAKVSVEGSLVQIQGIGYHGKG